MNNPGNSQLQDGRVHRKILFGLKMNMRKETAEDTRNSLATEPNIKYNTVFNECVFISMKYSEVSKFRSAVFCSIEDLSRKVSTTFLTYQVTLEFHTLFDLIIQDENMSFESFLENAQIMWEVDVLLFQYQIDFYTKVVEILSNNKNQRIAKYKSPYICI